MKLKNKNEIKILQCSNCLYYLCEEGFTRIGLCRRYPPMVPMVVRYKENVHDNYYPIVGDSDWCGEWKAN